MDKEHKFELVISIDFGTTFSGYAYAYIGSEEVIANQNWLDAYSAEVLNCIILSLNNFNFSKMLLTLAIVFIFSELV